MGILGALGGGLSIGIIITAVDNYSRQLTQAQGKVKAFSISLKSMAKIGAVAFAALGIAATVHLGKAAASLIEIENKFDVVFASVSKDANRIAEELQKSYGLAGRSARQLMSDTGDLLTGFGFAADEALDLTEQVNKLAVDLASFTNIEGGAARASMAITKGLLGERESMKLLGIAVNENTEEFQDLRDMYVDVEGKTLVQAKALATLDIALSQSKNAIGDYARTSDSMANQMKLAKERFTDFQDGLAKELTPTFLKLTEIITDNMDTVMALANALGVVLVGTVKGLVFILNTVSQAGVNFAEQLHTVGAAIQWLVDLIEFGWTEANERLEFRMDAITNTAAIMTEEIWGTKAALDEEKESVDSTASSTNKLNTATKAVIPSIQGLTSDMKLAASATNTAKDAVTALEMAFRNMTGRNRRESEQWVGAWTPEGTVVGEDAEGNQWTTGAFSGSDKQREAQMSQAGGGTSAQSGFDGTLSKDTTFKAHTGENVNISPAAGGSGGTNVTINVNGTGDPATVAREIYKKFAALGG